MIKRQQTKRAPAANFEDYQQASSAANPPKAKQIPKAKNAKQNSDLDDKKPK